MSDENDSHETPEPAPPRNEAAVREIAAVSIVVTAIIGACAIVGLTKNSPNQLTLVTTVFTFAGLAYNQLKAVKRAVRSDQQIHQDVKVVKHQTNGELDSRIQKSVTAAVAPAVAQAVAEAVPAAVTAAVSEALAGQNSPPKPPAPC